MIEEKELLVEQSRFRSAPFFEQASELTVTIGGLGGIGSWLTLYLSRIVKEIYGYDYDSVEKVNLAGQLFTKNEIANSKVIAALHIVKSYGTALFNPMNEKVSLDTDIEEDYVFSAFDNMEARKALFSIWKQRESRKLFIDGRLLLDQYEVYVVQKGQEDRYEATLFEDSEVPEIACTFKQTSHFASICAARMTHAFTNYLSQHMFYKVPFKFKEEGALFHTEIEF